MSVATRLLALCTLLLAACGGKDDGSGAGEPVAMATTTSTNDTGLLQAIIPQFEKASGVKVKWVSVGTGQALKLGEKGDADVVLVHDRAKEDEYVKAGHATERRDVMWNDFLIVGPAADPAKVKGAPSAATALAQIAGAKAPFISRGDDSGTHSREKALWKSAGGKPAWDGYAETGQGMGLTLTVAHERQGYALADRGTWLSFRKRVDLVPLVEGDKALRNPYGVLPVTPALRPGGNPQGARKLVEWLTSAAGQAAIGAFTVEGEQLFHPSSAGE